MQIRSRYAQRRVVGEIRGRLLYHSDTRKQKTNHAYKHGLVSEQWTREIGGAWVEFGAGAAVTNVTLLSDFSAIQMRHLPSKSSARSVQELLADVGISVSISDINFIKLVKHRNGMAIVKVKDPEFAKSACWKLGTCIRAPDLEVTQIPVPYQTDHHLASSTAETSAVHGIGRPKTPLFRSGTQQKHLMRITSSRTSNSKSLACQSQPKCPPQWMPHKTMGHGRWSWKVWWPPFPQRIS